MGPSSRPNIVCFIGVVPTASTGETLYTLVYARDPPLPIHNLIKVVEPYKGDNELRKRIEQSRVSNSIAAKWLSKMRERETKEAQPQ